MLPDGEGIARNALAWPLSAGKRAGAAEAGRGDKRL